MLNYLNSEQKPINEGTKKLSYQEPHQNETVEQEQSSNMTESEQSEFERKIYESQIANVNQVQMLKDSNQNSVEQEEIMENKTFHQAIALKGEGSFGKVEMVLNYENGEFDAVKYFNNPNDYAEEKNIYYKLIDSYTGRDLQRLEKIAILPKYYNNDEKAIYFVPGVCSLQQLLDNPEFRSTPDQAVHIFSVLLEFLLLMREKGYRHSDLKPDNTELVRSQDDENQYVLKVIDFGSLNQSDEEYGEYSPAFFNNPKREYAYDGNNIVIYFRNIDEMFKNEFYTVIRTMQSVLLGPNEQKRFKIGGSNEDEEMRFKNLEDLQAYVNERCKKVELTHLLNEILKFITEKGLEESYTFWELEEFHKNLISEMVPEQKNFIDIENIIKKIEDKQIAKHKLREDPLKILFGLNCFVNQLCSFSESHAQPFDLTKYLTEQLFDEKENITLVGQSGAGKTLLLIKLMKELREENEKTDFDIVMVRLRELSGATNNQQQNISENLCAKIDEELEEENALEKKLLLVLLDGYDELNDKNILIHETLDQEFRNKYKKIKILVTTRSKYATGAEINHIFNTPKTIYICPFNKSQRADYMNNFLTICNSNKELSLEYEIFEHFEEYEEMFDNFSSLDRLSGLPFTLSIVILMMPQLKRAVQEKNSKEKKQCTKYEIYELFLDDYVSKRVELLYQDDDYQKLIIEKYGEKKNHERCEAIELEMELANAE